jgi:hypothetical protein
MKQERVFSFIVLAILIAVIACRFWFLLSQAVRAIWHSRRTDQIGTRFPVRTRIDRAYPNKKGRVNLRAFRAGRRDAGTLIGVEEGACSEQSKTIPRPLQILQTMLKPARGFGAICDVFPAIMIFLRTEPSG